MFSIGTFYENVVLCIKSALAEISQLISRVRYVLADDRKSLSPVNFEAQIFLHANKKHWTVFTIQEIPNSYPDDKQ